MDPLNAWSATGRHTKESHNRARISLRENSHVASHNRLTDPERSNGETKIYGTALAHGLGNRTSCLQYMDNVFR